MEKKDLIHYGAMLVVVMAALAVHQKFVAPMLAPKAAK